MSSSRRRFDDLRSDYPEIIRNIVVFKHKPRLLDYFYSDKVKYAIIWARVGETSLHSEGLRIAGILGEHYRSLRFAAHVRYDYAETYQYVGVCQRDGSDSSCSGNGIVPKFAATTSSSDDDTDLESNSDASQAQCDCGLKKLCDELRKRCAELEAQVASQSTGV